MIQTMIKSYLKLQFQIHVYVRYRKYQNSMTRAELYVLAKCIVTNVEDSGNIQKHSKQQQQLPIEIEKQISIKVYSKCVHHLVVLLVKY